MFMCLNEMEMFVQVKISGGGRCNVTTGLYSDPLVMGSSLWFDQFV